MRLKSVLGGGRRRGDRWLVRGRIGPKLATKTPGAQAITKLQRGKSYSCVKNKESVTANLYGRRRKSGKTPHRSAAPGHVTNIPARGRLPCGCAREGHGTTAGDFFRAVHRNAQGTGDPRSPALKIRLAAHRIKIGLELRHAVNFFYLVTPKTIPNQRTRRLQSPPNLRLN